MKKQECNCSLFELIDDYLFILDPNGIILETNKVASEALGYSNRELLGKPILSLHPDTRRDEVVQKIKEMSAGRSSFCNVPLQCKNGSLIPVETRVVLGEWKGSDSIIGISRNVDALQNSEAKFYNVFNSSYSAMAIYDQGTDVFINVNRKFVELFGLTAEELTGRSIWQTDIFLTQRQVREFSTFFKKGARIQNLETVFRTRYKEEVYCQFSSDNIKIGRDKYYLITINDINRLKQYEKKLQYHLYQQKLIADISQQLNNQDFYSWLDNMLEILGEHTGVSRVYIFEDSRDGLRTSNTFEWCNKGILPQKDSLQDVPYEIIPSWKRLIQQNGMIFSKNIHELPEDLVVVLEPQNIKSLLIFPIMTNGTMIGFIGFDECCRMKEWSQDEKDLLKLISNILSNAFERQLMLERIRENETRLEWALDNAREGVWDWDMNSGKVYYNQTWLSMLGFTMDDVEPSITSRERIIHPDDIENERSLLHSHINFRTDSYENTLRVLTGTGRWKWILDKGKVISRNPDGTPARFIGKITDLTDIKLAESQLKSALEKEKELNDLKSRFVSSASHEFRTPLASILITSDSLRQYWEKMDKTQIETRLDKIQDRVIYLTRVVNDVLELSKLQEGKMGFKPEQIDLVEICRSIIEEFTPQFKKDGVLNFLHDRPSILINADKLLLYQILNNLLSNAIKYSHQQPEITLRIKTDANELLLCVADNGIGIPEKDQQHVFEPFFRAGNVSMLDGSGLGLNIVKESVTLHNGKVSFISKMGYGTTFCIHFPKQIMIS